MYQDMGPARVSPFSQYIAVRGSLEQILACCGLQGLQPATNSPIADLRRTVDRARCTASRRGEENSNVTLFLIGAAISAIGTEAQNHCGWATATLMACAASAVAVSLQLSRRVSK